MLNAFGAVEIYGAFKMFSAIGNIVKSILKPMDALTNVLDGLTGVASSAKKVLDTYSEKIRAEIHKDKV